MEQTQKHQHVAMVPLEHLEMRFVLASIAVAMPVSMDKHMAAKIAYMEAAMTLGHEGLDKLITKLVDLADGQCKASGCPHHG